MRTYKVKYITLEGDTDTVIVEASSKKEAKKQLKCEYWDVREILNIKEI